MNNTRAALSILETVEKIKPINTKIKYLQEHRTPLLETILHYATLPYPKIDSFPLTPSTTRECNFNKFINCVNEITNTPTQATEIWGKYTTTFSSVENYFYKQLVKGKSFVGIPQAKLKKIYDSTT